MTSAFYIISSRYPTGFEVFREGFCLSLFLVSNHVITRNVKFDLMSLLILLLKYKTEYPNMDLSLIFIISYLNSIGMTRFIVRQIHQLMHTQKIVDKVYILSIVETTTKGKSIFQLLGL